MQNGTDKFSSPGQCGAAEKRTAEADHHGPDYVGVLFPQGLINEQVAYFNHDDIDRIYFTGYNDEGMREMTDIINDFVEKNPELNRCTAEEWEALGKEEAPAEAE